MGNKKRLVSSIVFAIAYPRIKETSILLAVFHLTVCRPEMENICREEKNSCMGSFAIQCENILPNPYLSQCS